MCPLNALDTDEGDLALLCRMLWALGRQGSYGVRTSGSPTQGCAAGHCTMPELSWAEAPDVSTHPTGSCSKPQSDFSFAQPMDRCTSCTEPKRLEFSRNFNFLMCLTRRIGAPTDPSSCDFIKLTPSSSAWPRWLFGRHTHKPRMRCERLAELLGRLQFHSTD